jgi:hypothetical protein
LKVEIVLREEADPNNKGKKRRFVEINTYLTSYKNSAILYTVGSHIRNMIVGVTKVSINHKVRVSDTRCT